MSIQAAREEMGEMQFDGSDLEGEPKFGYLEWVPTWDAHLELLPRALNY